MYRLKWTFFSIAILIPGIVCNSFFENKLYKSGKFHFGISFIALLLMAIIGFAGWRLQNIAWVKYVWGINYLAVFAITVFIKLLHFSNEGILLFSNKLDMLFVSPVPFMVYFVAARLLDKNHKQENKSGYEINN